jgi:TRAP transporter 4TM/12TM fusion protein
VLVALYYGIELTQNIFGAAAPWVLGITGIAIYLWTVWYAARFADLELEDPNAPIVHIPRAWDVTRTGLDFLIPLVVLLWCLMVEQMSPGLSAFWATVAILGILATRKPLLALFRRLDMRTAINSTIGDVVDGLATGARNMIGIAIATATAGIVVGTITLTGLGLMMTEFVEFVSGGNVIAMLILIAAISLILGMGIPTTANYILVATLMAPVVVELGAQAGLAIPLIAVHLFVFYFGIMADITPPVGLAAFAAAAISKEDPIATGFQGSLYSLRTAILPFVFIFNPEILLIDIGGWGHLIWVIFTAMAAILLFSAATMNWFITKSRWWETAILLLCCFTLFRPGWWLDRFYPAHTEVPAREFLSKVQQAPSDQRLTMVVEGLNLEGENIRKTVSIPLGDPQEPRLRLRAVGLGVTPAGEKVTISNVAFGSYAKRIGLESGYEIVSVLEPAERPSRAIPAIIALVLAAGVGGLQYARSRKGAAAPAPA